MALIYMDSFDNYSTLSQRWPVIYDTPTLTTGRFGNAVGAANSNRGIERSFAGASPSEVIVGFALYVSADNTSYADAVYFREGGIGTHVWMRRTYPGAMQFFNGASVSLGSTASGVLTPNAWNYVEIRVKIHDTLGEVECIVNGTQVLDLTNQDTHNGGTGIFNTLRFFGSQGQAFTWYVDDLYVLDTTGLAPTNTFLGDCRVESKLPNGNGNSSDFVGSDADSTDNYLLVDETAPNADTDYVEGSSIGDEDTYAYQDLTTTQGTIYGVQLLPYARKTDAGARSIKGVARSAGLEEEGADIALSTSYAYYTDIHELDPNGAAWTVTSVNGAEFGVKVSV